jgi:ketosteroid isomerase-like protein
VLAAFNALLEGIRHADVDAVANAYLKSPRLILFNYNGSVTRGWDQMRQNRASSYPDLKDVKLDVRDLRVLMLGRDGALVSCLWTQSQTFRGVPETATGRMTIVFRRAGKEWKAVHLHTSPDMPAPGRVMPSEQTPTPVPKTNP